jgi:hypothetical protein
MGDVFNSDGNTSATNYAPDDAVPVTHMIALDLVNDKIYWGDAGVGASGWSNGSGSFNQAFGSAVGVDLTANLDWFFAFRPFGGTIEVNFGATAFTVSPPTGYSSGYSAAIENENRETALTIQDGSAYFQATAFTGNASANHDIAQTGNSTFQPDFVWGKNRALGSHGHRLFDAVRGVTKVLQSANTDAEATDANGLTAFNSNGFEVGNGDHLNGSGNGIIGWQWLAGNSTASNSNGSITSTVSANQTAGFSIVSWTGSGANATIGHGLGAVPEWIIIKNRSSSQNWPVYFEDIGNDKSFLLDTDGAQAAGMFQDTTPTSTVFSVDGSNNVNKSSENMIAYCWCGKPGFSKFGTYVGNGQTNYGAFIETGFKPAWFLARPIGTASDWSIFDSGRSPVNVMNASLAPNTTAADYTHSSAKMDFIANGIKIRGTFAPINSSGQTIIYAAFAENPFAGTTPITPRS